MNCTRGRLCLHVSLVMLCGCQSTAVPSGGQTSPQSSVTTNVRTFATPAEAMEALISAAEKFDVSAIEQIFGAAGKDILVTAEPPHDRDIAHTFAELAYQKKSVSLDPRNSNHAVILVGPEDWPLAVPLVKKNGKWSFDTPAGILELTYRRVGGN